MKTRKYVLGIVAALGITTLVGSGSVFAAEYPLTLTDSTEKEITLDAEPAKIISVAPNMTELIFALEAQDKLIGRSDYCDYPAEVTDIESVGSMQTPDVEKIISLNRILLLFLHILTRMLLPNWMIWGLRSWSYRIPPILKVFIR